MKTYLDKMKSLKNYNDCERVWTEKHLSSISKKYKKTPGSHHKTICAVLGYLWETEKDEFRRDLILEAAWMGRRMSIKLEGTHNIIDEEKYE